MKRTDDNMNECIAYKRDAMHTGGKQDEHDFPTKYFDCTVSEILQFFCSCPHYYSTLNLGFSCLCHWRLTKRTHHHSQMP